MTITNPEHWVTIGDYSIKLKRCLQKGDLGLSGREQELLCSLVQGNTLKEIARELDVTPNTAATMKNRIYRKLGVNNLAGASAIAAAFHAGGIVQNIRSRKNKHQAA